MLLEGMYALYPTVHTSSVQSDVHFSGVLRSFISYVLRETTPRDSRRKKDTEHIDR